MTRVISSVSAIQTSFMLFFFNICTCTVNPVSSGHSKRRPKLGFLDRFCLNVGQKYCREHSAIRSTYIKLPFVVKIGFLSIFEWPLKTGFTVHVYALKE